MEKQIVQAIRYAWDSLDSHLDLTHNKRNKGSIIGDRKFHKKAVKDYAYIIKVLADLL